MIQKTKFDQWCESVIEAGWLAALVVAPMFFNVFSSRVFEPDKISLIRSIALIMLVAWLTKLVNGGGLWLPGSGHEEQSNAQADPEESSQQETPLWQRFIQIPFLLPIALLILAYGISTLFSVARFVSWWGSYQRLQGTYTFLSYVIIALLTVAHLRRADQIRRLQHVIIVTSLPIAIYGVIQHYDRDPLPWGGDVTIRIAANAGNAIFLAAYLIMALFFTLERVYSSFAFLLGRDSRGDAETPESMGRVETAHDMPTALAGGAYLFILMVQLLAIFWTQSRGPLLGLLLGFYIFWLLLFSSLRPKGYRMLATGWVLIGVVGVIFLVLLNTTAIVNLVTSVPSLARLGRLLDLESNTAQVRVLIWQGAAEMVAPHPPLIYPNRETDAINFIRPLVGYGPEAMWVAYNPFYPPDLAHHEKRNASPDRAHNETWDALVITGGLGFLAYMSLFLSVFYWALRWLGLISNRRDNLLFAALLMVSSIGFILISNILDGSWRFFGVALPAGLMLGLWLYVSIAVFLHSGDKPDKSDSLRQLMIVTLIATIAAHFVEIHFGIAIAATRTYFWVESALLLILGMRWAQVAPFSALQTDTVASSGDGQTPPPPVAEATRGRNKRPKRPARPTNSRSARRAVITTSALPTTVLTDLLVFFTMVFIYTTNSAGLQSASEILWNSITRHPQEGDAFAPAILFLMLFTWLVAATLGLAAEALQQREAPDISWWLRGFGLHALIVWGGWLVYGMIQAGRLIPGAGGTDLDSQLDHVAGHFAFYTWFVVGWLLVAGTVYAWPWLRERRLPSGNRLVVGAGAGLVFAIIFFAIISNVNIELVKADIIYKQGQQFDSQKNWISSIELYRRALLARTTEDHYMLFLGRSLLEQAKQANTEGTFKLDSNPSVTEVLNLTPQQTSQMSRFELLRAAEVILLEAQTVNPLNTDHTANLARLYRTWADLSDDAEMRQQMLDKSVSQYEMAVTLSPHAAHLWNERGSAFLAQGKRAEAEAAYLHSFELDSRFDQTYLLLADFYMNNEETVQKGCDYLKQGVEKIPNNAQLQSYLGVCLARVNDLNGAVAANIKVLELSPNNLGAMRNLSILYRDMGQINDAIVWAQRTIDTTSSDAEKIQQRQELLIPLYQSQGQTAQVAEQYELIRQFDPNNATLLRTLYNLYVTTNDTARAINVLQSLTQIEPDDYQHQLALGQQFLADGQIEAARPLLERALELAPDEQKANISQLISQTNPAE